MKKQSIDQLREGSVVGDFFAVAECDRKMTAANKSFLSLVFADATGRIPGVAWDNIEHLTTVLVPDSIVRIEASVTSYKGGLQLRVLDARPLKSSDKIDTADFMPKTPHDISHLYRQLVDIKNSVAEPMVRAMLDHFFDDTSFADKFKKQPAAKRMHHAYTGGLLEHTLSVAQSCVKLAGQYPFMHRDLLVAGALLHDIGKIEEMSCGVTTDYTVRGQLVGHLTIGSEMIGRAAGTLKNFPDSLKWELQHLVLSHHGQLEFGSPVLPVTIEALTLHALDMLDAQLFQARAAIVEDVQEGAQFTKRVYGLDRTIYKRLVSERGPTAAPVATALDRELDLVQPKPAQESLL